MFPVQNSAQRALQECEKTFSDMIRSIERMQQEMAKLITSNKRAALNNAEGHMERLSHEIADLKRRDSEITQLSRTEDHIHFIQVTENQSTQTHFHLHDLIPAQCCLFRMAKAED